MPRGGARVGAGRKPKSRGVVLGMDGARIAPPPGQPAPAAQPADAESLATPPKGLSQRAKAFWKENAPHALAMRTLTTATLAGFRELCEQWAMKQAIADKINAVGATDITADDLLRHYVKLAQRVDSSLARFKLTAMGKAVELPRGSAAPKAANPWAQVAAK